MVNLNVSASTCVNSRQAVRHCIYSRPIQNLLCYMICHSDQLFQFPDRRVRDIKVVRSTSNKKSCDSTLQMVLHENGVVSMRSFQRFKPSEQAKDFIGAKGKNGDLKKQPIPAVCGRDNSISAGSRVFAREHSFSMAPW